MDAILSKRCTKCGEFKSLNDFCKNKQCIDGLHTQCNTCRRKAANERYAVNKQTILMRMRNAYAVNPRKKLDKNAEWQKANPNKMKAIQKRHYEKHAEDRRESVRRSRKKYRDNRREYERRRRKENPSIDKIKTIRRQALRRGLPDSFTTTDWQRALDYFDHCCAVCGRPAGLWHTIAADHWIPLSSPDCTGTIPTNIVPLCHGIDGCNNSKCNKNAADWLISKLGKRKANAIIQKIEDYFASLHK